MKDLVEEGGLHDIREDSTGGGSYNKEGVTTL